MVKKRKSNRPSDIYQALMKHDMKVFEHEKEFKVNKKK